MKPDSILTPSPSPAPLLSWRGFWLGHRFIIPLLPGILVFAAAFGASAFAKGMTLLEAVAMSALVYAGVSQMVGLEMWRGDWNLAALAGLVMVTIAVNGRMALQSASLQPWLSEHPRLTNYLQLAFLTDANWMIGERYRAQGGRDLGVVIGAGIGIWVVWVLGTIPGYLLGQLVTNPARFGLDLVVPILFAAMGVSLWKGRVSLWTWPIAALVSLVTWAVVPGYAYIVTGALAGACAGAFVDDGASNAN
jgi:predicted branched-subunit amino acid permease